MATTINRTVFEAMIKRLQEINSNLSEQTVREAVADLNRGFDHRGFLTLASVLEPRDGTTYGITFELHPEDNLTDTDLLALITDYWILPLSYGSKEQYLSEVKRANDVMTLHHFPYELVTRPGVLTYQRTV